MYRVIKGFFDLTSNHAYSVGDEFPYNGAVVAEERIAELSGNNNKVGAPLIEAVKVKQSKKNHKQ